MTVAHYILNVRRDEDRESLRANRWPVDRDEPHRDELAAGDLVLVYLAAPAREFIARAELASAVDANGTVLLAHVEDWDPPVPMSAVLSRIDRSAGARADFDTGVVQITAGEYETALAVANRA